MILHRVEVIGGSPRPLGAARSETTTSNNSCLIALALCSPSAAGSLSIHAAVTVAAEPAPPAKRVQGRSRGRRAGGRALLPLLIAVKPWCMSWHVIRPSTPWRCSRLYQHMKQFLLRSFLDLEQTHMFCKPRPPSSRPAVNTAGIYTLPCLSLVFRDGLLVGRKFRHRDEVGHDDAMLPEQCWAG